MRAFFLRNGAVFSVVVHGLVAVLDTDVLFFQVHLYIFLSVSIDSILNLLFSLGYCRFLYLDLLMTSCERRTEGVKEREREREF